MLSLNDPPGHGQSEFAESAAGMEALLRRGARLGHRIKPSLLEGAETELHSHVRISSIID